MSNPNQYFLLADHIKLSLLERQRAISLNLEPTSQDGHISRSLDSLREGLESIIEERIRFQEAGDIPASSTLLETEKNLQKQYNDLASQFRGVPTSTTSSTITHPNDPSLSADFARATERPRNVSSSSFLKKSLRTSNITSAGAASPKSVRFSDSPQIQDEEESSARNALFPYRDDPTSAPPDQSHLDNQQIHAYHSQVLAEQDEALDRLGESIGRQRELSIQIGDELDEHVQMLDDVDRRVDRHQSSLDKARKNLGTVARKAKDNMQLTVIVILIIVLVLLIIILK
ncbi:related to syntaxin 8 [Rhynchosporium agropyri]|uniref:Related to syntaxin 8 n=3 Tax=Rhynchosporium TaxID=38037 RepID=A0A1E1MKV3_RHYSE|nr:related to syntaxin 8 [Rhynchosporium agropyri]CZS93080.1 related to syntaxin 8 [Rhynchosporium commune]CZT49395.1 related to syntaxin 8 [Rhynchosporium secalis]